MADLTDIITSAVADAGISSEPTESPDASATETPETVDTPEVVETPEVTPETGVDDKSVEEPVDTVDTVKKPVEKPVEKPTEKDQFAKDLEELGIQEPKLGERENRLPHSRVKKIVENYGKKIEARFTGEAATLKSENTRLTEKSQNIDKVDQLIASDPERYLTMLSTIHPEYKKFLGGAKAEPVKEPVKAASTLGARPQPDVTFEDKSRGYSPEQHDKLLEWVANSAREQAVAESEERFTKRFGGIEKSFQAREALNAEIPKVREVVKNVYDTWGKDLVDKHEDEIVALMKQNPSMATAEAVSRVLVPKVRADRNVMRGEILAETKKRTAAAAKTVPSVATAGKEDNEPSSIEDVIRRSVATLKR